VRIICALPEAISHGCRGGDGSVTASSSETGAQGLPAQSLSLM